MFTEAQLIQFGNFLFTTYNVKESPDQIRQVSHADLENWKCNPENVTALFKIHQDVTLAKALGGDNYSAFIIAINVLNNRVSYDVHCEFHNKEYGDAFRLYRVSENFVYGKS